MTKLCSWKKERKGKRIESEVTRLRRQQLRKPSIVKEDLEVKFDLPDSESIFLLHGSRLAAIDFEARIWRRMCPDLWNFESQN